MVRLEPQQEEIMVTLMNFCKQRLFEDFTVQLAEGAVRVSRILMAAMSPVFGNMLSLDMLESRSNEVSLRHVTRDIWLCITDFYYGSQKLVTVENVVDILHVSHMYELFRLEQYCVSFLRSVCSPENCLAIKSIASKFGYDVLAQEATRVLGDNFSSVCKSEDFLSLERSDLRELLEKEELVTTEDDLCQALLEWMEAKKADKDTCEELFRYIRLKQLSDVCLSEQVMCHNVLAHVQAVQCKVQKEILRRMKSGVKQAQVAPHRRHPQNSPHSLVLLGKNAHGDVDVFVWSFGEKKWTSYPGPPQEVQDCFSAALLSDTVFVTGGTDSNETHLYTLDSRTWTAGPDLVQGRGCHGMAVIRDEVFVVAGYHTYSSLSSVEQCSLTSKQWTHSGDLQVATYNCGVATQGDTILVVGGGTEETGSLIQTFDFKTRTAAVLDVQLPRPMSGVRPGKIGAAFIFAGDEGDLIQVSEEAGKLRITAHVVLKGFPSDKSWYALHVTSGSVLMIGGSEGPSVEGWNLQGEKMGSVEVAELPEILDVFAWFACDIPQC